MELELDDGYRERLAARAERLGFESTEAYAQTIVETVLDELDDDHDDAVQDRLEDLGYL